MLRSFTYLLICLLLSAPAWLTAQSEATSWQKQISTDITPFFTRILNFGGTASTSEMAFFYRSRPTADARNFRLGLGLRTTLNDGGNGINQFDLALSLGSERTWAFAQRWEAYFGWDTRFGVEVENFGNLDQTLGRIDVGAGLVGGLNFAINRHLALSTEAALPVFLRFNVGSLNEGVGLDLRWQVPSVLYLHYRW